MLLIGLLVEGMFPADVDNNNSPMMWLLDKSGELHAVKILYAAEAGSYSACLKQTSSHSRARRKLFLKGKQTMAYPAPANTSEPL